MSERGARIGQLSTDANAHTDAKQGADVGGSRTHPETRPRRRGSARKTAAAAAFGCAINPLNSSMIALAVADVCQAFRISLATASLLISVFYLTSCVLHPLAGRLADRLGARRTYCAGLALVALSGLIAAIPGVNFAVLVACRALQAAGSAAAFPSASVLLRGPAGDDPPARALGYVGAVQSTAVVAGTAIGGLLVMFGGWRAVFVINLPLAVLGLMIALVWLPDDRASVSRLRRSLRAELRDLDLPGAGLFAATIGGLVAFLVSIKTGPQWPVLVLATAAGILLVHRELSDRPSFLSLDELVHNTRLAAVLLAQFAVQGCFYLVLFGVPLWLAQSRGFTSGTVTVLALPLTVAGMAMTPLAIWVIRRGGSCRAMAVGSAALLAGSAALLGLGDTTSVIWILLAGCLLGIPSAFHNLGLQTALYQVVAPERLGKVAGLFQTTRYLGVMLLIPLLGLVSDATIDTQVLHQIGWGGVVVALVVLIATRLGRGARGTASTRHGRMAD
jgi:MFS family permease